MSKQTVYLEFVTGMMGTGKTTYIQQREKEGAKALYVGQVCRHHFGSANMAKDPLAGAPESTEQFVRELVMQAVSELREGEVLVIDGMPRKPSQVRWLFERFIKADHPTLRFKCSVYYFTCHEPERRDRAELRDQGNEGDNALRLARMEQEPATFFRVLEELLFHACEHPDFTLSVNDTTCGVRPDNYDKPNCEGVRLTDTNLVRMFESHRDFSNLIFAKKGLTFRMEDLFNESAGRDTLPQMAQSVQWARKFVEKAQGELAELLREIPDEWWSKDEVDIRKARVELIDAWHFMISAAQALGMMAPEFSETFFGKQRVNIQRQEGDYSKKNKDRSNPDDAHVGKLTSTSVPGSFIADEVEDTEFEQGV